MPNQASPHFIFLSPIWHWKAKCFMVGITADRIRFWHGLGNNSTWGSFNANSLATVFAANDLSKLGGVSHPGPATRKSLVQVQPPLPMKRKAVTSIWRYGLFLVIRVSLLRSRLLRAVSEASVTHKLQCWLVGGTRALNKNSECCYHLKVAWGLVISDRRNRFPDRQRSST